jgi:hypothetical protein
LKGVFHTVAEWGLLPALKITAVNLAKNGLQDIGPELWSLTSGATAPAEQVVSRTGAAIAGAEPALGVAAPLAIGGATITDIQIRAACAGYAPAPLSALGYF